MDVETIKNFATALLIGALIGIEREKRKTEEGDVAPGGLRTFILFAEIGAIVGWMSERAALPWLLVAGLVAVTMPVVSGYILAARAKPRSLGLTTEVAALATYLLGAMTTMGQRGLAVGLAIATAAVLAYKQPLHGAVARLGWDDVFAGLRLLIASFIVLPLLPNRTVDPWDALNPYSMWLQVLLISSLSLVGYAATRWLGRDKGVAITGLTGGLVSSTAVTESARTTDANVAANAIIIAAVTNTVVKCGLVMTLGARPLKRPVVIATAAVLATGVLMIALS